MKYKGKPLNGGFPFFVSHVTMIFTGCEGKASDNLYADSENWAYAEVDVTATDYPPVLSIFEDGIYHLYDYQFFYRNLQENVEARISEYFK